MSAVIQANGKVRQLDRQPRPEEQVRPDQASDPVFLARFLGKLLRSVSVLERRFSPRRLDFEDLVVDATGTTKYRLEHKFGGRVRFWVVDWTGATAAPSIIRDASTDNNTLALVSKVAGTVTIRVEQVG